MRYTMLYLECVLVCHTVSQCLNVLFFVISSVVQHVRLTCLLNYLLTYLHYSTVTLVLPISNVVSGVV